MTEYAKEQIAQLEAELAEFQASSRELEKELELELEESEQRLTDLSDKVALLTADLGEWKAKYNALQKEYGATQASLQKQIASLQEAHKQVSTRLMEIEMTNDDMERNERITKTSLEELEQKYYGSLEEIAMLESDLATKDTLAVDLQRSKDELRDTKEELSVAHSRIELLERQLARAEARQTPSAATAAARKSDTAVHAAPAAPAAQAAALFRSASSTRLRKSDPSAATTPVNATADRSPPSYYYVSSSGAMVSSSPNGLGSKATATTSLPRMTSSKSLRKIHGMLDQMKNLETRVAHFKSSLPKPVATTPVKGSPTNTPSPRSRSMTPIASASSPESPSNLPVASLRRSSPSMNFIGKPFIQSAGEARRMGRMSRTRRDLSHPPPPAIEEEKLPARYRLETIQGSPADHAKRPSTDGFTVFSNTSSSSIHSTDEKQLLKRPGSAFSALHARSSIGHGRYV